MSDQETSFLEDLTDEEVETLSTYIDKCAEAGVEPTLEGLVMESEKFAEEVEGAYALGRQLAHTSAGLASQLEEHSDTPFSLIKNASDRYEDAGFAICLAEMAQAAIETVAAVRNNE
jgi:hypothetical protein